jgi:hypothetical protein
VWNNATDNCKRGPCQWSDVESCANDNACEWFLGNQTCIQKICPYSTETACDAHPARCQYSPTSGTCGKTCAMHGTQNECVGAACDWTFEGVCKNPCSQRHLGNEVQCQNDNNCLWSFVEAGCVATCAKHATDNSCTNAVGGMCLWEGSFCKTRCNKKYEGASQPQVQALCGADTSCELVVSTVTPSGGGGDTVSYKCIEPCSQKNTSSCTSTDCRTVNGQCTTTCSGKYSKAAECTSDSGCMWSDNNGCEEDCADKYSTQAECASQSTECKWDAATSKCGTTCSAKHSTDSECSADSSCLWYSGKCTSACNTQTIGACGPAGACTVVNGACSPSCELRFQTNVTCDADAECMWNYLTGKCAVKTCTGTDAAKCAADASGTCEWVDNTCTGPCSNNVFASTCGTDARCAWNDATSLCNKKCALETAQSACTANTACTYINSQCLDACDSSKSEVTCTAATRKSHCDWDSGLSKCRKTCFYRHPGSTTADQIACDEDTQCVFETSTMTCTTKQCNYNSAAECRNDATCDWTTANQCTLRNCSFTSAAACDASAGCNWALTNQGVIKCEPVTCSATATSNCGAGCELKNGKCEAVPCTYTTQSVCALNASCTWGATGCGQASQNCLYSAWSAYSTCSLPCDGGQKTRTRTITQEAIGTGTPCNTDSLSEMEPCNSGIVCDCSAMTDSAQCVRLTTCVWAEGVCKKRPNPETPCAQIGSMAQCNSSPRGCMWLFGHCVVGAGFAGSAARRAIAEAFDSAATCTTGMSPTDPAAKGYESWTINPAVQPPVTPIHLFPSVPVDTTIKQVTGLMVTIQTGFNRGIDQLVYAKSAAELFNATGITAHPFQEDNGALIFVGKASVADYVAIIQNIYFFSASYNPTKRVVTWNYVSGGRSIVSLSTKHMYRFSPLQQKVSWTAAKAACASSSVFGVPGYLATIASMEENDVLSQHLLAEGWIGATDSKAEGVWDWATEADRTNVSTFWNGNAQGAAVTGAFAHWEPAGVSRLTGEPTDIKGFNFGLFKVNGYWSSRMPDDSRGAGYICEFGSTATPLPTTVYGSKTVQLESCAFPTVKATLDHWCAVRNTELKCVADPECGWDATAAACVQGCAATTSVADCLGRMLNGELQCHVSYAFVPAKCITNVCSSLGAGCAGNDLCVTDVNGKCVYNEDCTRFTSVDTCRTDVRCKFDTAASTCGSKESCASYQTEATCVGTCQSSCLNNPQCIHVANATAGTCATKECTATACGTGCNDRQSTATATFSSAATPQKVFPSVTGVTATSAGFVVSVVEGLADGDLLLFSQTGNAGMTSTWNADRGMLTVTTGEADSAAVTAALQSVLFVTSSTSDANRVVSWSVVTTVGGASLGPVYLPTQKMFVEFVASENIDRNAAAGLCAKRTHQSITGALTTVSSLATQKAVVSAVGSKAGWLGGKGQSVATINIWQWADATVFFRGDASVGVTETYVNFAPGSPSALATGTKQYTVMNANGQWIEAGATTTVAAGYFCSYVGAATAASAGVATLEAKGCFPKQCAYSDLAACGTNPACDVDGTRCVTSKCGAAGDVATCNTVGGCYFDATLKVCAVNRNDACRKLVGAACAAKPGCAEQGGECGIVGCTKYPDVSSCADDASCMVNSDGKCAPRLCGFASQLDCIGDSKCTFNPETSKCQPQACIATATEAACKENVQCDWSPKMPSACSAKACPWDTAADCNSQVMCLWANGQCGRNSCPLNTKTECGGAAGCAWDATSATCGRGVCAATTAEACKADEQCSWSESNIGGIPSKCGPKSMTQLLAAAAAAAEESGNACEEHENRMVALAVLLAIFVVALIAVFAWMVYRQGQQSIAGKDRSGKLYTDNELDELIMTGHTEEDARSIGTSSEDSGSESEL